MPHFIEELLTDMAIDAVEIREAPEVSPSTPLGEVYRILDQRHLGAVVVSEEGRLVGIFTERDVLYRTAREGTDPATPISELMTPDPATLSPHQRVAEGIARMVEGGFRQVPLVDDGRLVGLLTSRAILRFIAQHYPEAMLNLPPRLHQTLRRPEGG